LWNSSHPITRILFWDRVLFGLANVNRRSVKLTKKPQTEVRFLKNYLKLDLVLKFETHEKSSLLFRFHHPFRGLCFQPEAESARDASGHATRASPKRSVGPKRCPEGL
jgi:hypothetical protein